MDNFDWQDFARRFVSNGALGQIGGFGKQSVAPSAIPSTPPARPVDLVQPPAVGGYPSMGLSQPTIDALIKALQAGGIGQISSPAAPSQAAPTNTNAGMPMGGFMNMGTGGLMNMPGMGGIYQMLGRGK